MSVDDIKQRFEREIELRAYDDQYIDRNEEREILEIALQLGIGADAARGALSEVCAARNYVLESGVLKTMRSDIEAAVADDGKVDRGEFEHVFHHAKDGMKGKKTDREIKKMIVLVMEDTGHTQVKTGWFSDWYASLKKELGMR